MALQRIIGVQPAWVRPPYGALNDQVIAAANARGQNRAPPLLIQIIPFIDETTSSSGSLGLRLWRYYWPSSRTVEKHVQGLRQPTSEFYPGPQPRSYS